MKKISWSAIGLALLVVFGFLLAYGFHNGRDRHPDYVLDINIKPARDLAQYQAGFAAIKITPQIIDTWTDKNRNAYFDEKEGDTFDDNNKNGRFDAVWIAGFQNRRAASTIHDDLWARAMVLDDGQTRIAIVAVDLIGFTHKNALNVRKKLSKNWKIDYSVVCSTHNHQGPDMLGMWGDSFLKSGVNADYEQMVEDKIVDAIGQAVQHLKPANLSVAQDLTGAAALTTDTRKPIVKDDGLYVLQATDATADTTLGTFVVWGNHPETLWNENLAITSDFPHYVREGLEKGVYDNNKRIKKGLSGIVVYATGCVGGLMTTSPEVSIKHPFNDKTFTKPSFEKAEAQGTTLALLVLKALEKTESINEKIQLKAQTFEIPLDNPMFRMGVATGVLDAGYSSWLKLRTEAAVWTMGQASFITIPGEIYPEIVNGGIEIPAGADLNLQKSIETPPLRRLMKGKYKFVIGLANDEIGYIIPQSEWDEDKPYIYGSKEPLYGEINSVGPQAAPIIHQRILKMLK
jgi:predicted MPP superfamily phosphohydrolase